MQMGSRERVDDLESDRIEVATCDINNELTSHRSTGTAEVASVTDGKSIASSEVIAVVGSTGELFVRRIPVKFLACSVTIDKSSSGERLCEECRAGDGTSDLEFGARSRSTNTDRISGGIQNED